MGQNSLSLFEPVLDQAAPPKSKLPDAGRRDTRDQQQRHLQAARRLARRMAKLPDQSPEQLHAGRMICRHLVAMLKETESQGSTTPH